ncbi:hypothetical protein SLEP1_g13717 [Rubroshorea leprosula]|uniref:Uncharacterized protein n=1 Tax=Rubroshorea leprosula TaxID=152421 RepID=A0AAV5IS94_9ROSI|nr:hypothetical protein SLEP1_g13717 [Rubroshorea leprosula]
MSHDRGLCGLRGNHGFHEKSKLGSPMRTHHRNLHGTRCGFFGKPSSG